MFREKYGGKIASWAMLIFWYAQKEKNQENMMKLHHTQGSDIKIWFLLSYDSITFESTFLEANPKPT